MVSNSENEFNVQGYPKSIKGLQERVKNYSQKTAVRYTSVWNKLLKKYDQQENILVNPEKSIETVVTNIISEYSNNEFRDSTFRQYRASIIYRLCIILNEQQSEGGKKIISLPKIARIFESLKNVEAINADKKQPRRSSSSKAKYFPKDLYEHVQKTQNEAIGSKLGVMLKWFLEANIYIGLRPVEWLSLRLACDVESKCLCLVVDNGKNSNGRANGDFRIMDLLETDRDKLKRQLRVILGFKRLLDIELEKKARKFLADMSSETGKQYQLYISSKEPDQYLYETVGVLRETINGINAETKYVHGVQNSNDILIHNELTINGIKPMNGTETVDGINSEHGQTHGAKTQNQLNSVSDLDRQGRLTINGIETDDGKKIHGAPINTANGIKPVNGIETANGFNSDNGIETANGFNPDNGINTGDGIGGGRNTHLKSISQSKVISQSETISREFSFSQKSTAQLNSVDGENTGHSNEIHGAPNLSDFGLNTVGGNNSIDGNNNSDNGLNAVLLSAFNTAVVESYVDRWGTIQYAICQSYMDSLQSKLYRICNEFYKNKKIGLPEEIELNKMNATIYSTRHQAVANRKKAKWKLDEIAGWFGHASIDTASRHYGRAGRAWGELPQYRTSKYSVELVRIREAVLEQELTPMTDEELMNEVMPDQYLDDLI